MQTKHLCFLIHICTKGEAGTMTLFKPSCIFLYCPFQGGTSFVDHFIIYVLCLSCFATAHCCLVVTCWERTDLLTLVCDVYCVLLLSHVESQVRCGTLLYRFLIFAILLTLLYKFSY